MEKTKKPQSRIVVFSTSLCPYCDTLKEFLKENNIKFEEVDVSRDEKLKDEIIKKSGQMGVPVVEINGEMIAGFDKKKICQLLDIKE
ncbi:MAG TPA: glutaredoxin domain-containing protein [Candidatus Humimicrobiaceae bacterium]|nr:glutaredoxin domain-containing protein [Candidatus Humimicrobiaceae bacterium]